MNTTSAPTFAAAHPELAAKFPNLAHAITPERARHAEVPTSCPFPEGPVYCGYTEAELRMAFAAVQDTGDWKAPIDRTFDRLRDHDRRLVDAAIGFYAGGGTDFRTPGGHASPSTTSPVRVIAPGYYAEIGS